MLPDGLRMHLEGGVLSCPEDEPAGAGGGSVAEGQGQGRDTGRCALVEGGVGGVLSWPEDEPAGARVGGGVCWG